VCYSCEAREQIMYKLTCVMCKKPETHESMTGRKYRNVKWYKTDHAAM
jgi:hypothetical protein